MVMMMMMMFHIDFHEVALLFQKTRIYNITTTQRKPPKGRKKITILFFTKCGGFESGITKEKSRKWSE